MTRNEEYTALLEELKETPPALEQAVERALARKRAVRKKKRIFGIPVVSLAACFGAFVLLVNLFPPFAAACGGVPLLRELAKAVAWSPSLSAAVENDYVQPMGQSQTVNGITATVEYVIVDQKQLNIFFTLKGDYDNLSAEMPEFSPDQHCAVLGADYRQAPGTLLHFTLDYMDGDVPEGFTMTFGATTHVEQPYDWDAPESSILDEWEEKEPDILAEFTFDLRFDPTYTAQGERIPVNQTFSMDSQTLIVTEAEVYPTHVRINVAGDEANTAWLKGLEFYLENEDGERFSPISNGISGSGDPDSPAMWSFRLESPYFSRSKHLTLCITGATWLEKDMERIHVNLAEQTAECLPEGVALYSAERKNGGWIVQFSAPEEEDLHFYQLFGMTYYDAEGNPYEMDSRSTVTTPYFEGVITDEAAMEALDKAGEGKFFEVLPLRNYPADEVWLCPSFSHITAEEPPVVIVIK